MRTEKVDFGVTRDVGLAYVPEAGVGVGAGIIARVLTQLEAQEPLAGNGDKGRMDEALSRGD
jgi:glucokinase